MTDSSSGYVVVARRYRPQSFDDLIGQTHVARALKNAISSDRVGHAYLFTGARGVGKTSAARILAKALNCVEGPTATPCNTCEVCQSVAEGDDVDVLEIDGASNRGIDEIRQLRQNVAIRPTRVRFKIYIIDEVHMLTREAFNALLKTLEEPPGHVKFIFATTEPQKVPITILSRCQRFDFAGIEAASIEQRLAEIAAQEGVTAEAEALALIARRAAGSMRDSQSLLEQLLAVADGVIRSSNVSELLGTATTARLAEYAECLKSRDASAALEIIRAAIAEGADIGQFWEQLIGFFRDVMVAAVGGTKDQFLYALPAQEALVQEIGQAFGTAQVLAVLQILESAGARMRMTVDPRTLAEMATVRICYLPDLQNLADLLRETQDGSGAPASGGAPSTAAKKNIPVSAGPLRTGNSLAESVAKLQSTHTKSAGSVAVDQQAATTSGVNSDDSEPRSAEPYDDAGIAKEQHKESEQPWNDAIATQLWQSAQGSLDGILADHVARASRVSAAGAGRLVAWYEAKYNLCKSACTQLDHRSRIEEALEKVAGFPVQVDAQTVPDSRVEQAAPTSRRQKRRELAQRPFVGRALELFADETADLRIVPPAGKRSAR